jgi:hypothetical protein
MECQQLEVYSDESNFAIVRMPGRHFPGCVIQGDSLSILLSSAETICELAATSRNQELMDEATALAEQLAGRLTHYESVLKAHGIKLPYFRGPVTNT